VRLAADLLVDGLVIVEIKAVAKVLPIHHAQMLTYLKLRNLNLGMIINFNVKILRLGFYRIVMGRRDLWVLCGRYLVGSDALVGIRPLS
jgi:hypothetical protein